MAFNPKVSIIIPVYNGSNYLCEAINSALAQTYKNVEIIVINDGSNDGGKTEKIAKSYGDSIRYFYQDNGGVASALNFGIRMMKGDYFSWLSHDDIYYPNKIEEQVNFLGKNINDVILYTDFDYINSESKFIRSEIIENVEPRKFIYALITSYPINGCTALIPKTCFDDIGLFNENLKTAQDYELWFRMAKKYEFIHISKILLKSRIHPEQGTIALNNIVLKECDDLYHWFIDELSINEILSLTEDTIGLFYIRSALALKTKGYIGAANFTLKKSLRYLFKSDFKSLFKNMYLIICYIPHKPKAIAYYYLTKLKLNAKK